jgi:hypothetical protein
MAFCPQCESEYVEGVSTCPDSPGAIPLVASLSPRGDEDHPDDKFVEVLLAPNLPVAQSIAELLDSNGIECFVNSGSVQLTPQEVRVMVADHDVERARELIDAFREGPEGSPICEGCGTEIPTTAERCPQCGATPGGPEAEA